ncbi:hypothetical protein J437_LFUL003823 [Ladona fulva]|uniref:Reverse transcriptase domain-containing protein n=1 Tax=Ladona fulva TaxID=123851 RepID=A0A8K0KG73_LADFU|nr:hypothetical protein J437_LFUL003823 [Ladona fulva]
MFYDFSNAFDTVNYYLLLNKLSSVGIRGVPYEWIHSYLTNRNMANSRNTKPKRLQGYRVHIQPSVPRVQKP